MAANVIFCTCPDDCSADSIAEQLVKKKLAACVNIVPGLRSVYRWENQLEKSTEVLLIIKAPEKNYKIIEQFIQSQHPYELPEIIALPVISGEPGYLEWLG